MSIIIVGGLCVLFFYAGFLFCAILVCSRTADERVPEAGESDE